MNSYDSKWMTYLIIVIGIAFLLGRVVYWTMTVLLGDLITADGVLDIIRSLVTPAFIIIGIFITTFLYNKNKKNSDE